MAPRWLEGTVVGNVHWTDWLYSLRVEVDQDLPFEAGQFGRLALDIGEERVARPYSFVNAPGDTPLEFYSIIVPEGPLSPRLQALTAGDKVWVDPRGAGFFVLSELPEADHLWMLSTGTGLGPYLSILKTPTLWERFEKVVLVHAVRHMAELTYSDSIEGFRQQFPGRFTFAPFVSREPSDFALAGRLPHAIDDGRLEKTVGLPLHPDHSQVMLCGNPNMVKDTRTALEQRGLKKNRRRTPGHITSENYW
ncbi:MAG: ferredoxin--NADP reductase [Gammaproteobacteria bacterium]